MPGLSNDPSDGLSDGLSLCAILVSNLSDVTSDVISTTTSVSARPDFATPVPGVISADTPFGKVAKTIIFDCLDPQCPIRLYPTLSDALSDASSDVLSDASSNAVAKCGIGLAGFAPGPHRHFPAGPKALNLYFWGCLL